MKAKLAYLCSSESWGGLEMNHVRNAKWMLNRGHDVVVLCVENSNIHVTAINWGLPVLLIAKHKKYYDFPKAMQLVNLVRHEKISHLLIRSNWDMSIVATVKFILKEKIHTSYFMEMQLGVKKTNPLHTLRYRYIDVWSCPLPWLMQQVKSKTHFTNTCVLIPSGIELDRFSSQESKAVCRQKLALPESGFFFGLIGRFDPQKGQLLLLEAMKRCSSSDFSVVFLGEPTLHEGKSYYHSLLDFIEEHQLHDRVYIRPFREDPVDFYRAMNWLVMATKAETFGMVTLESLASGTPVVGSNAGGTPEILQGDKGGLLFQSQNPEDLAKKLEQAIAQSNQYTPEALKKMVIPYSHTSVCEKIETALQLI